MRSIEKGEKQGTVGYHGGRLRLDVPRPKTVASVEHAIQVLEVFSVTEPLVGVNEIARRIGLHGSTVSRLLASLETGRLVEQDPASGRYRLGAGAVSLAGVCLATMSVREAAHPYLQQLSLDSRESVNMSVWDGQAATNVEQVPSPHVIQHLAPLGRRNPPHASATGKVFLAHAPERAVENLLAAGLPKLTPHTIVDAPSLSRELEQVRRQGYATNSEELELELVAVAAPIFDHRSSVVAAISVSAPAYRVDAERLKALGRLVKQTAAEISRRLGYVSGEVAASDNRPNSLAARAKRRTEQA